MRLETERLILRTPLQEDAGAMHALWHSEFVGKYNVLTPMSLEKMREKLAEDAESGTVVHLVLKSTGRVIGNFTANAPHPGILQDERLAGMKGVSLSFAVSAQHQRKGYISEALRSGIDVLFRYAHVDYINCGYFDFNTASAAVQKKFGFRYFSTHAFTPKGGTPVTVIENILTREEYFASLN